MLCAFIHNQWTDRANAKQPRDFLLYEEPLEDDMTAEELDAKIRSLIPR